MFKPELRTYYAYLYSVINTSKNQLHNFSLIWLGKFLRNFVVHFYKPSIFLIQDPHATENLDINWQSSPFQQKKRGGVMSSQENIYIPNYP